MSALLVPIAIDFEFNILKKKQKLYFLEIYRKIIVPALHF